MVATTTGTIMTTNKLRIRNLPLKGSAILPLLAAVSLQAQPSLPSTPEEIALAGSAVARTGSIWTSRANPASAGSTTARSIAASFSPSALGIEGWYEGYAVASLPLDSGIAAGAALQGLGAGSYRELTGSALGSITIAGIVRLGAAITIHSLSIEHYGSAAAASLDIGAIMRLGERIRFGGAAGNITRSRLGGADLPGRVAFGFAFDLDGGLTLSADAWQELRRSAGAALALSGSPAPGLTLRGGIGSGPGTIALGVSYDTGEILIDYGGAYIAPVGFRHAVGAGIMF